MNIYLYTFSKRRNSTGIPSGEGTEVSVALKAPTSEQRPTFVLRWTGELAANYVRWGSRWYWVTDVTHRTNDVLEVTCAIDELATLRSEIMATDAFVLYDTTPNTEISDGRLSVKTSMIEDVRDGAFTQLGIAPATNPNVVLTVTGEQGVGSYMLPESTARTLLTRLSPWMIDVIPDPTGTIGDEYIRDVASSIVQTGRNIAAMGNVASNIRASVMLPLPSTAFAGSDATIWLGTYNTRVTGRLLDGVVMTDYADVSIPWPASDWRRNAPYTAIRLYIPWVGLINYPSSALIDVERLRVSAAIDLRTGDAIFTVYALDGAVATRAIGRYAASVGASYPIGGSNLSPVSAVSAIGGVAATAAAVITGNLAAGAAGIVGITNSVRPLDTTVGGVGSAAAFALSPIVRCIVTYHDTVVPPASVSSTIGTPTMAVKRLATLSGYVQTRAASVSADAPQQMIDAVNASLDGGVYIE